MSLTSGVNLTALEINLDINDTDNISNSTNNQNVSRWGNYIQENITLQPTYLTSGGYNANLSYVQFTKSGGESLQNNITAQPTITVDTSNGMTFVMCYRWTGSVSGGEFERILEFGNATVGDGVVDNSIILGRDGNTGRTYISSWEPYNGSSSSNYTTDPTTNNVIPNVINSWIFASVLYNSTTNGIRTFVNTTSQSGINMTPYFNYTPVSGSIPSRTVTNATISARLQTDSYGSNSNLDLSLLQVYEGEFTMDQVNATYSTFINGTSFIVSGGSDAICFLKDTMITMGDGEVKPIQDVQVGDMINTSGGPKEVIKLYHKMYNNEERFWPYNVDGVFVSGQHAVVKENKLYFARDIGKRVDGYRSKIPYYHIQVNSDQVGIKYDNTWFELWDGHEPGMSAEYCWFVGGENKNDYRRIKLVNLIL